MKSSRGKLVGIIHAQKNAIGMSDSEYRDLVNEWTGKNSCSDCGIAELEKIFRSLNLILQSTGKKAFWYKKQPPTLADAVVARAQRTMGEGWGTRLAGFLEKIGRKSLGECNEKELRQTMGFLSRIEREGKRK